jgi:DNA topoisomerase-2
MASKNSKKSIESTYQMLSDIEHVLKAPDSYVGSIEMATYENAWVFNEESGKMEKRDIDIVPGLYKTFDELLVNAVDQYTRVKYDDSVKDKVTKIEVEIDPDENIISVRNNGKGFDVAMHEEHKLYVPEMILGHLRTSQNYDKTEKKIVGGKNGLGAKLANIFSTYFKVETVDADRGQKYVQIFEKNMSITGKPSITKCKGKPYTRVTYKPDLEKFGLEKMTDDIVAYMKRRVYDICACTDYSVSVWLNGVKLDYKDFEKYVNSYIGLKSEYKRAYENVSDRWEVVACLSPDDKPEQVSFVNGIYTRKGGKHVDKLAQHISRKLCNYMKKNKPKKSANLKEQYIRDNLWLFIRCNIENPSFTGQIKEELETPHTKFGSKCEMSDKFIENLSKTGIVEKALMLSDYKKASAVTLTDGEKKGKLRGIPKYVSANKAGGKESHKCTLILTEGDSAKSSARAGISAIKNGNDYYGLFPLRGKLLNIRECTKVQEANNEEINSIIKILGLKQNKKYKTDEDIKTLRYGHVMILTDQDVDGSHIKGLVINFLHCKWPELTKFPNFVTTFGTPIVKLFKGKGKKKEVVSFYTLSDYNDWKDTKGLKGWTVKYYKGLGTSTSDDFKEYFKDIVDRTIHFVCDDEKICDEAIKLAFEKKRADDRKEWIMGYDPKDILDQKVKTISYHDFIHKELKHFSVYDLERSLPSICDGLKPSQRKVLFGCLKRNLFNKEIKVAQLSGYVSEHSCYHHGEVSLNDTIVGMAQDFVGSNNINLLMPNGQFGTRLAGGKSTAKDKDGKKKSENDVAAARYIFTELNPVVKKIIDKDDCEILEYLEDDGTNIEPKWYMPTLPLILINGTKGIGTGFSTEVPCFNPVDIISNLKLLMEDKEIVEMTPWYRGFKGKIEKVNGKFESVGVYKKIADNAVQITELPIGTWTNRYIEHLETLTASGVRDKSIAASKKSGKKKKEDQWYIKDIRDNSSDIEVNITVVFKSNLILNSLLKNLNKFENLMNLRSSKFLGTTNMCLFDHEGKIQKYSSPEDILEDFYLLRLAHYIKRRKYILQRLSEELNELKNKVKFIEAFVNSEIDIINKEDNVVNEELTKIGLDVINDSYDYLTSMPIRSLTKKKIIELKKKRDEAMNEYKKVEKKTPKGMWKDELKDISNELAKLVSISV